MPEFRARSPCLGGTVPSRRPSALATPFPQEHLHLWRQEGVWIRAWHSATLGNDHRHVLQTFSLGCLPKRTSA